MFNKSFLKTYLIVTLINCLVSIFFLDLKIFLIRQFIFSCVLFFANIFEQELTIIKKDYQFLQAQVIREIPFFKYEFILSVFFVLSIFLSTLRLPENFLFLYFIFGFYNLCFLGFSLYKLYIIMSIPNMRAYFFNKKSYALSFHKLDSRPYSSFAISSAKFCFECVKITGIVGGTYLGFGYGLPKSIYGANYRSPIVNSVGYFFTGLKCDNEVWYSIAVDFVNQHPTIKSCIVEDDGFTVSRSKLVEEAHKLKFPLLDISKYK